MKKSPRSSATGQSERDKRTAFALLLYTVQRASAVKGMSWQDIEIAAIRVVQGKTGAKLWIPLHAGLDRILEAWPKTGVVMLTASFRKPFTSKGFVTYKVNGILLRGATSLQNQHLRAYPLLMESKAGSKFLFCRASYRKTASHFSGSTLVWRLAIAYHLCCRPREGNCET